METQEIKIKEEIVETNDNEEQTETKNEVLVENKEEAVTEEKPKEILYFQCSVCSLREAYDYFGMNPPYTSKYLLMEDAYVIEDPFLPPKTGQFIILGSVCVKCKKSVCKDSECSIYFDQSYCMKCAKKDIETFPRAIQEKINKHSK